MSKAHYWTAFFVACVVAIAGHQLAPSAVLKSLIPVFVLALLIVYNLTYSYFAARRTMLNLVRQPYAIEWLSQLGKLATTPALLKAHDELESLGYRHVGDYRPQVAETNRFVACYVHQSEPIYGQILVLDAATVQVFVALASYFEGGGELETTGIPWGGGMDLPRPPEVPHLIQMRAGGTAGALHGQHIGTLHAWIAGGRKPLPATREAFEGYERERVEMVRAHVEQRGGLTVADFLRMISGKTARGVLRF